MTVEILEIVPHDAGAYTQGLLFDEDGRLFESTGLEGSSTLRELHPETGAVLRSVDLAPDLFGEGLALVDDRLVQITWTERRAFVYARDTFDVVETFDYDGEGWGLCHDGETLVMSDGTSTLTFRDPETFAVRSTVTVTAVSENGTGEEIPLLNELECVGDDVYANIYRSDTIAVIDARTGVVEATIDAASLPRPGGADVLNGIAIDPDGDLWLTGKWWDSMYRVRLVDA